MLEKIKNETINKINQMEASYKARDLRKNGVKDSIAAKKAQIAEIVAAGGDPNHELELLKELEVVDAIDKKNNSISEGGVKLAVTAATIATAFAVMNFEKEDVISTPTGRNLISGLIGTLFKK